MIVTIAWEPEVLIFDFKYNQISQINILQFFNTLPNTFKIHDFLYNDPAHNNYEYMLKGLIFYWSNHYFSFFRVLQGNKYVWLRFDDNVIHKKK